MKTPIYVTSALLFLTLGCNDGPKVVTAKSDSSTNVPSSGIFSETEAPPSLTPSASAPFSEDLHKVVVQEVLPTSKYVYMNVTEAGEQFWIAAPKQEITVGATYFYRGGLLKTNFESKEHNRVFDRVFLVTNLVPEKHGDHSNPLAGDATRSQKLSIKEDIPTHTEAIIEHKGSVKIAELLKNPKQYQGKTVQLTGKVIKVNPNIMKRNWIHLQDGSQDSFDLVITSNSFVPEGSIVTMKGEVSLNRDFGAGYKYDLIIENGEIIE
jgi:hypothetical protein